MAVGAARHKPRPAPSDAEIKAGLGTLGWKHYQAVLKKLAGFGLEPEFYRYGPSGGWTVRFQINHATGCALYLSRPPIGLVAVSRATETVLQKNPEARTNLVPLVSTAPRKGKVRWVQIPLGKENDVNTFLSLVRTRLEAASLRSPETSGISRKSHRQTTPAAQHPETADKSPRRSTARRSSRG